jgi:hypothetical protein
LCFPPGIETARLLGRWGIGNRSYCPVHLWIPIIELSNPEERRWM